MEGRSLPSLFTFGIKALGNAAFSGVVGVLH
jgi:hypothetical protein